MINNKRIYLDNAATTSLKPEVLDCMMPYLTESYGNPSSIYKEGQEAKAAIEKAREQTAALISASPREIYFCGSGTEADNWAIRGAAYANKNKGNHIITTAIEHHAVLHTCETLTAQGFDVEYIKVDKYGQVSAEDIKSAITDKTILISVMYANNEVGTIMPIEEIGSIAKERGVVFHTDAVQALDTVDIDVNKINADLLTISAHKFGGPKGVGALYVRNGCLLTNIMYGGAQERKKRAGTENVSGIVGLGKAAELAVSNRTEKAKRFSQMRDYFINKVNERIPHSLLNGHPTMRLAGNVNFSFEFIEGEGILLWLDNKGIAASSGSACTSGSLDPSHVLLAMGLEHQTAHSSIRFSFGDDTQTEHLDYTIDVLAETVEKLRAMSPINH